MKWYLLIPAFFVAVLAENECRGDKHRTFCANYNFKSNEQFTLNPPTEALTFYRSTGSIGTKTLSSLPGVKRLKFEEGKMIHIEDGSICSLPTLEDLELDRHKMVPLLTASLLNNCQNLKSLTIRASQIEPTVFSSMASLEELQLSYLNISHFTKQYFEPLKNLTDFRLYHSVVAKIDPGAICVSPKMKKMIIKYSRLPPLNKRVFENCNRLTELYLAYAYGQHGDLEENVFQNLPSLRILDVSELSMKHLTKSYFVGSTQLESLSLYNTDIGIIDSDAFSGLTNLRKLGIGASKLNEINPAAFENLENLKSLNLGGNQLKSIDTLRHPQLEELYVDYNEISTVDVKAVKANLPKLKKLSMNWNGMDCTYRSQLIKDLQIAGITVDTVTDIGFGRHECP